MRTTISKSAAACLLKKHVNISTGFASGQAPNDRIVTYYDPTDCGGATYPFQITEFSFSFIKLTGNSWPVPVDIVVFEPVTAGDNCSGPGTDYIAIPSFVIPAILRFPISGPRYFLTRSVLTGRFTSESNIPILILM